MTYPDQKTVAYDPVSRFKQMLDWNARLTQYSYYANGQAHTVERPNAVTTTYTYDPLGRLVDLKHSQHEQTLGQYAYTYNLVGNRVRAEETLAQVQTPPSQFSVTAAGYLAIQLAWPDSTIEETGYRLERSTDNQQHWQQIAELPANTLRYTDYGLLRHTAYWYRLTAYNASTSQAQTLQTETGMDPVTEDEGSSVITYDYDRLNRLTEANYDNGQFFHYTYDANGNRLGETTTAGTVISDYDLANRLTSVGGVTYTWDNNGNLTGDGQSAYSYDSANRLTKIEQNGAMVSTYGYNGLGDRLTENSTQFVLDLNTGLSQVLADGTNIYLYGNGRIAQVSAVSGTTDSAYFLGDALGSVRQLVDGNGTVTLAKSYEPYGEVLSSMGNATSIYGYTGEIQEGSQVFLRSRYYDSVNGRFLSRDTWPGDNNMPMSYNAWLYSYENPINLIDPSGKMPIICEGPDCVQRPRVTDDCVPNINIGKPTEGMSFGSAETSPLIYQTYQVLRDDVKWWGNNYTLRSIDQIDFLRLIIAHEFGGEAKTINTKELAETIVRNFYTLCKPDMGYLQYGMICKWGDLKSTIVYIAAKKMLTIPSRINWLIGRNLSQSDKEKKVADYWFYSTDQNLSNFSQYFRNPDPEWASGETDEDRPMEWGNRSMIVDQVGLDNAGQGSKEYEVFRKRGGGDYFILMTINQKKHFGILER